MIAFRCRGCGAAFRTAGAVRVHVELLCRGEAPPAPTDDDLRYLRTLKGIELVEGEAGSPNGGGRRRKADGDERPKRSTRGPARSTHKRGAARPR